MSQAKVDRNKELKRNRKKIVKRERRMRHLYTALTAVVCLAAAGWIGYSGYTLYTEKQAEAEENAEIVKTPIDISALTGFSLDEEETEN